MQQCARIAKEMVALVAQNSPKALQGNHLMNKKIFKLLCISAFIFSSIIAAVSSKSLVRNKNISLLSSKKLNNQFTGLFSVYSVTNGTQTFQAKIRITEFFKISKNSFSVIYNVLDDDETPVFERLFGRLVKGQFIFSIPVLTSFDIFYIVSPKVNINKLGVPGFKGVLLGTQNSECTNLSKSSGVCSKIDTSDVRTIVATVVLEKDSN